jgi:hypothetical protein
LHFSALSSSGLMKIASYGHAAMQALHPMQTDFLKSTIPSSRLNIACVGQADIHRLHVGPGHAERHVVLALACRGARVAPDAARLVEQFHQALQRGLGFPHVRSLGSSG